MTDRAEGFVVCFGSLLLAAMLENAGWHVASHMAFAIVFAVVMTSLIWLFIAALEGLWGSDE